MGLKIGRMVLGPVSTNCYFIYDENEKKAIVVDPAAYGEKIFNSLSDNGIEVGAIILTHGHFDHIMGVNELKAKSHAKVYALADEKELLLDSALNCSNDIGRPCIVEPDGYYEDNEKVSLCGMEFKVLATPGHTPGSCCYYFESEKILISGDTLFEGSVGRTDLPGGSTRKLNESIERKILPLDDKVKVYPGHGNNTLIGDERMNNPFF